jgi:hypothetical protein
MRAASLITQITRIGALWPATPNGRDVRQNGGYARASQEQD